MVLNRLKMTSTQMQDRQKESDCHVCPYYICPYYICPYYVCSYYVCSYYVCRYYIWPCCGYRVFKMQDPKSAVGGIVTFSDQDWEKLAACFTISGPEKGE